PRRRSIVPQRRADDPGRTSRRPWRRASSCRAQARLGTAWVYRRTRAVCRRCRFGADRRSGSVRFRILVRAPLPLRRRAGLRCPSDRVDGCCQRGVGAGAALCPACPGGSPHRRCRVVYPDRGPGSLVSGLEPHPELRREPLRSSHAHRTGTTAGYRLMAIDLRHRPALPMGTDPASVRQRIEAMENLLERLFVIPGINRPIGLDVILDLIPGVGDIAGAALGAYIVWEAKNLGMSKWKMARMAGNVGIDFLLGLI